MLHCGTGTVINVKRFFSSLVLMSQTFVSLVFLLHWIKKALCFVSFFFTSVSLCNFLTISVSPRTFSLRHIASQRSSCSMFVDFHIQMKTCREWLEWKSRGLSCTHVSRKENRWKKKVCPELSNRHPYPCECFYEKWFNIIPQNTKVGAAKMTVSECAPLHLWCSVTAF